MILKYLIFLVVGGGGDGDGIGLVLEREGGLEWADSHEDFGVLLFHARPLGLKYNSNKGWIWRIMNRYYLIVIHVEL